MKPGIGRLNLRYFYPKENNQEQEFKVEHNTESLLVQLAGAGGGGHGPVSQKDTKDTTTKVPGGGGSGAFIEAQVDVQPGQVVKIRPGRGGAAGQPDGPGQDGESSFLCIGSKILRAGGGLGGQLGSGGLGGIAMITGVPNDRYRLVAGISGTAHPSPDGGDEHALPGRDGYISLTFIS